MATTNDPYVNLFNWFKNFASELAARNQQNYDRAITVDRLQNAGHTPANLGLDQWAATWTPTPAQAALVEPDLRTRPEDILNAEYVPQAPVAPIPSNEGMVIDEATGEYVPALDSATIANIASSLGLNNYQPKPKARTRRNKSKSSGSGNTGKIQVLQPNVLARQQEPGIREYINEASDNYWKGREAELDRVRRSLGV